MFIDLTMSISDKMPFNPDHFPPEVAPYSNIDENGWTASRMVLSTHNGTHMDAPRHFVKGAESIDNIPLDLLIGPAQIIHLDHVLEEKTLITPAHLPEIHQPRVLLHTKWLERTLGTPAYFSGFPILTPEAAIYLAEKGVRLFGLDAPSIDYDGDTHTALLSRGIVIIENLINLQQLEAYCELIALPLPLKNGDGSPIRAVANVSARN
ncbi:MAG TPA: cyclase family protein [Ktedonobacteraceae bacterium]